MLNSERFQSLGNHWSADGGAISFYYSPAAPENLAHKNTVLGAKEQLRELARGQQQRPAMRGLFERMRERLENLNLENPHGLALLAAVDPEVWFEAELPYAVESVADVGNSFMVSQLAPLMKEQEKYFVLLLDRAVTRLVLVSGEDLLEKTKEFGEPRQQVRETGTGRKASDERSKDDDSFHHLREVGTKLFKRLEQGEAKGVYFGCRNELWQEIEAAIPDNVLQKTLGHFHCDPGLATLEEVRGLVRPLIDERVARELQQLADDVRGQAAGGRNGAVGPERIAQAVELGEVQMILVAPHEPIPAGVCCSCEHIDLGMAGACSLCGSEMRRFDDLEEVIARRGGGGTFELLRVPRGMIGEEARGFMAALRFRADRRGSEAGSQAA